MDSQSTFEIYIDGMREGKKISPESFDIDEWMDAYKHAKNLLFPEHSKKDRPLISVQTQAGSIRIILTTGLAAVLQVQALLANIQQQKELGILPKKQAEAVRFFHKMAVEEGFQISMGQQENISQGLHLDRNTEFQPETPAWVEVEPIVWGKVVNIGGKANPNIHLETKDYGTLIIAATEEILASEKQNRIYQQQQIKISIKQNAFTGEYDNKSAHLIEFIDYDMEESVDSYLDRLVKQATPNLSNIQDPESWLNEIRGYED